MRAIQLREYTQQGLHPVPEISHPSGLPTLLQLQHAPAHWAAAQAPAAACALSGTAQQGRQRPHGSLLAPALRRSAARL
eukprot:17556-Heterococcus_DN1.PRE.2